MTTSFETYLLAYIASHEDLIRQYGFNLDENLEAAAQDFFDNGARRGITFDPVTYLIASPDLLNRIGSDTRAAARYYIELGFKPGQPPPLRNIRAETLVKHNAIAHEPEAYLLRLAEVIPQLAAFIRQSDRQEKTTIVAAELTRSVMATAPALAPQVLYALWPGPAPQEPTL